MRTQLLTFLITLTTWTTLLGQDGSDILYVKMDQLDQSYIGAFVHFDFYNQSFRSMSTDTVTIMVDGKPIKFVEHRKDNGFNNWFAGQYLESFEKSDEPTVRIVKSRLDRITVDSVFVTSFLEYYTDDKLLLERSKNITNQFPRANIAEVLVSVDSYKKE